MPTNISIKNTNQRNSLKISTENLVEPEYDKRKKPPEKVWVGSNSEYIKPGEVAEIWVAETRRITIQEVPT